MNDQEVYQKWRNAIALYDKHTAEYRNTYNSDYHVDYTIGLGSFGGNDPSNGILSLGLLIFVACTALHLIISMSVEDVHFFSKNWFLFYLVLTLSVTISYAVYADKKSKGKDALRSEINKQKNILHALIKNHEDILLASFSKQDIIKYTDFLKDTQRHQIQSEAMGTAVGNYLENQAMKTNRIAHNALGNYCEAVCKKCGQHYGFTNSRSQAIKKVSANYCSKGGYCEPD